MSMSHAHGSMTHLNKYRTDGSSFSNNGEVFVVKRQTKALSLNQHVTVQVERGNFQLDTGAQCKVLPFECTQEIQVITASAR